MHSVLLYIRLQCLILVELSSIVVFRMRILVDIVVGLEAWLSVLNIIQMKRNALSDWSQTRLAGMDLAKSSIDWNSSSERSTAVGQNDILDLEIMGGTYSWRWPRFGMG